LPPSEPPGPSSLRFLLAVHNTYTEHASGAARSVRTIMQWLADAGHTCHALSTARFESTFGATLTPHLADLGVKPRWRTPKAGCREADYTIDRVGVSVIETRHNDLRRPDRAEGQQYLCRFNQLLDSFRPDQVLSYGGHPALPAALEIAHARGVTTTFTLRNHGYDDRRWFTSVDRVLTPSAWLARRYASKIGLHASALPSPILWSDVQGPEDSRGFLTFVNPALHKGAAFFARLADRLGQARPDIPILIVQSNTDATALAQVRGVELTRYKQIVTGPPIARVSDLFALTRILLVPSLFEEPFGRVAAEAMINGIPAIVSNRGGLPDTVEDGAIVCSVPDWMGTHERRLPEASEVEPWFEAVTRLWDDAAEYNRLATAARAAAHRLYDEARLRRRYEAWFTAPRPYEPLFAD
jgi:glycosyltransferase involved in cell wall biosynthesis